MPRRDPLLEQAVLETGLKLGPEENALRSLLGQLAGQYGRSRRVNASNAAGIREATLQATPQVSGAFEQALRSSQAQRAALGVQGTEPQAAAYERRVGEQKANALADLTDRGVRAEEGRVFANQSARDEFLGGKAKIVSELQGLAAQAGAETASAYGKARESQRQRAVTQRGQNITARGQDIASADRQASIAQREAAATQRAQDKAKEKAKVGAFKPATAAEHAKARDSIGLAQRWITRLSQGSSTSTQIRDLLETGGEVDVGLDKPLKVPRISRDYVNSAYDIQVKGGLSRANVEALHRRGLKIKTLGYSTKPRATVTGGTGGVPPVGPNP